MERRSFIKKSAVAASLMGVGMQGINAISSPDKNGLTSGHDFNLNYAPHFGMFKNHAGNDPIDQLNFMADQGFTAFEDNEMRNRPVNEQSQIAATLEALGMQMGVFVAHKIYWDFPNLTSGDKNYRDQFIKDIKDSIDVAKRVNAKWMTVVPGHVDLGKESAYQTANVIEALRRASEVLEPHDLIMVLEPLNWWSNHAGQFSSA